MCKNLILTIFLSSLLKRTRRRSSPPPRPVSESAEDSSRVGAKKGRAQTDFIPVSFLPSFFLSFSTFFFCSLDFFLFMLEKKNTIEPLERERERERKQATVKLVISTATISREKATPVSVRRSLVWFLLPRRVSVRFLQSKLLQNFPPHQSLHVISLFAGTASPTQVSGYDSPPALSTIA